MDDIKQYTILKNKNGYKLNKQRLKVHNLRVRVVKDQEVKKRNLFMNDHTYEPSDKMLFLNDIEAWRIQCYNVVGIL